MLHLVQSFKALTSPSDIPPFSRIITREDGELSITDKQRENVVVLQREDKTCFLIINRDKFAELKESYYQILVRLQDMGYTVSGSEDGSGGIFTADEGVISEVYLGSVNADESEDMDHSEAMSRFRDLVTIAYEQGASEVHIKLLPSSAQVMLRLGKRLSPLISEKVSTSRSVMESMVRVAFNTTSEEGARGSDDFSVSFAQESKLNIVTTSGKKIELRYQSSPRTPSGSKINLRILSSSNAKFKSLVDNGYEDTQAQLIMSVANKKSGMTLFCGETGSGKTTSLHVLINQILEKYPGFAIHSVEDPVEIVNPLIDQMPLVVRSGQTKSDAYAEALQALLRQDPDIIYQGEIRSRVQAEISQEAVLTGHGMLSSLHSQGAIDTIIRLANLGVDYYSLGGTRFFNAIVYQALFEKLCPVCSKPIIESDEGNDYLKKLSELAPANDFSNARIANHEGCDHCVAGSKGMVLCAEVFAPDELAKELIREGNLVALESYWIKEQDHPFLEGEYRGKTVLDHAIFKVSKGLLCPTQLEMYFGDLTMVAINLKKRGLVETIDDSEG